MGKEVAGLLPGLTGDVGTTWLDTAGRMLCMEADTTTVGSAACRRNHGYRDEWKGSNILELLSFHIINCSERVSD